LLEAFSQPRLTQGHGRTGRQDDDHGDDGQTSTEASNRRKQQDREADRQ